MKWAICIFFLFSIGCSAGKDQAVCDEKSITCSIRELLTLPKTTNFAFLANGYIVGGPDAGLYISLDYGKARDLDYGLLFSSQTIDSEKLLESCWGQFVSVKGKVSRVSLNEVLITNVSTIRRYQEVKYDASRQATYYTRGDSCEW